MLTVEYDIEAPEIFGSPFLDQLLEVERVVEQENTDFPFDFEPFIRVQFLIPCYMRDLGGREVAEVDYLKESKRLLVAVAVTNERAWRKDSTDFIVRMLRKANKIGFQFFKKRGMNFAIEGADKIVDKVKEALVTLNGM